MLAVIISKDNAKQRAVLSDLGSTSKCSKWLGKLGFWCPFTPYLSYVVSHKAEEACHHRSRSTMSGSTYGLRGYKRRVTKLLKVAQAIPVDVWCHGVTRGE